MSRAGRRRRGAMLLALALACGGLAWSDVEDSTQRVRAQVGQPVPVVVARADLRAGARLDPARLGVRMVPARFAPPDALPAPAEAAGARLAAPVTAGGYVTSDLIARAPGGGAGGGATRPGERAVDVAVAAGTDLAQAGPGARVDVLVTTERDGGRGRTYLALEDVELLSARPASGAEQGGSQADGAASRAGAVATLRVTVRQAVFLTAAQSFAREIRLMVRPAGERRKGAGVAVEGASL